MAAQVAVPVTRAELKEELRTFAAEAFRKELRQELAGLSERLAGRQPVAAPGAAGLHTALLAVPAGERALAQQAAVHGEAKSFGSRFKAAATGNWSSERSVHSASGQATQHEWMGRHVRGFTANEESQSKNLPATFAKQPPKGVADGDAGHLASGSGGSTAVDSGSPDGGDGSGSPRPQHRRRRKRTETPAAAQLAAVRFGINWEQPKTMPSEASRDHDQDLPGQVATTIDESSDDSSHTRTTAGPMSEGQRSSQRASQTRRWPSATKELQTALRQNKYSLREKAGSFVCSIYFDYVSGLLVFANAITLGVQTDFMARHVELDVVPLFFRILELVFCAAFTGEILLRIYVYRGYFFQMVDWKWNLFDIVIVSMQVGEEALMVVLSHVSEPSELFGVASSLTVMRILRVMRLVRIIRLVRVMRMIGELRTLVMSIAGSMKSLCWAVSLLFLLIYIIGVYITQIVSDHRTSKIKSGMADSAVNPALEQHYGTLVCTILVLFEAVTGGVDWHAVLDPLMQEISPWLGVLFTFYIAFVLLAMMNVVTGVFTETALLSAKKDKDIYMVNHVRDLFHSLDLDESGMITWNEIESQMNTPEFQEYFKAIDVDVSEAKGLFKLLDLNDNGEISADDFLNGCIRIRGPARALETMLLLREMSRMAERQRLQARYLESLLDAASAAWAVAPGAEAPPAPPIGALPQLPPPTVTHRSPPRRDEASTVGVTERR